MFAAGDDVPFEVEVVGVDELEAAASVLLTGF